MDKILYLEHLLTPSESNAQQALPLTLLVSQMIELATDHANHLGIGFIKLSPKNVGWVLSRLTVEMKRWPKVGETYRLCTWVETLNRHFSERCFAVEDTEGNVLGFARTVWMIIDLESHAGVSTECLELTDDLSYPRECPILRQMRHKPFEADKTVEYAFKYTDLDFYRHVNTVKYISLLLNQFSLECYDNNLLERFEVAFMHEAKYGETATIDSITEEHTTTFDINVGKKPILRSRIRFTPKEI